MNQIPMAHLMATPNSTFCESSPPEIDSMRIDFDGPASELDAATAGVRNLCQPCRTRYYSLERWRNAVATDRAFSFAAMIFADVGAADREPDGYVPGSLLEELDQRFDLAQSDAASLAETVLTMELDRLRLTAARDRLYAELTRIRQETALQFADGKSADVRAALTAQAVADDAEYQDADEKHRELGETVDAIGVKIAHRRLLLDLHAREMRYVTARLATVAAADTES